MDLTQNYFELFGLSVDFHVDPSVLTDHYRALQKTIHPDNFAGGTIREKRLAMQYSTFVNEAYSTLKDPMARALYMLRLAGVEIRENATLDPMFLMEQMELREELDEVSVDDDDALQRLDGFKSRLQQVIGDLEASFESAITACELPLAEQAAYKLQFANSLLHDAHTREERLLDY